MHNTRTVTAHGQWCNGNAFLVFNQIYLNCSMLFVVIKFHITVTKIIQFNGRFILYSKRERIYGEMWRVYAKYVMSYGKIVVGYGEIVVCYGHDIVVGCGHPQLSTSR